MLTLMRINYPRLFMFWTTFASVATVLVIAVVVSFAIVSTFSDDDDVPVIQTSDFILHTPSIEQGGSMVYSLWRKSFESCRGTVVTSFFPLDADYDDDADSPKEVITIRRPLSTPGYNSPPRLVLRNQVPERVVPGKYQVRVGVDSRCPTRQRFDPTANFVIEVTGGK